MSKKPGIPPKEQDTVEYIGPMVHEPSPGTVKPFIAPAGENTAVAMPEAVSPPLSRYKVDMGKVGFPQFNEEIDAADAQDAKKKFFEKYHIVKCEREPEITLIGGPV